MQIQKNISLALYTTFKIGGEAKFFGVVKNIEDLKLGVNFALQNSLPIFILGGGSNLLISDNGFNGIILKMELKSLVFQAPNNFVGTECLQKCLQNQDIKVEVFVGAGVVLDELIEKVTKKGLWGMENLSWIPGTVGASAVQNCGAFGAEVGDIISWVEIFDIETGEIQKISNEECQFEYRSSVFKQKPNWVVIRVAFVLKILDEEVLNCFANAYEDEKLSFPLTNFAEQNSSQFITKQSNEDRRGETSSVKITSLSSLRVGTDKFQKQSRKKSNLEYTGADNFKDKKNLTSQDVRNAIIEIRKKGTPWLDGLGSAGCFFKNPIISKNEFKKLKEKFPEVPNFEEGKNIKIPAAWFIDEFGWKGFCEGEVGVYNKHSLMLVNKGKGTCGEIKKLAKKISDDVFEKTSLKLEEEVVFV